MSFSRYNQDKSRVESLGKIRYSKDLNSSLLQTPPCILDGFYKNVNSLSILLHDIFLIVMIDQCSVWQDNSMVCIHIRYM